MSLSVTSDKENMARFGVLKQTLSIFDFAVKCSYVILILISNNKKKSPLDLCLYLCIPSTIVIYLKRLAY